jgi:hypothetical protein
MLGRNELGMAAYAKTCSIGEGICARRIFLVSARAAWYDISCS